MKNNRSKYPSWQRRHEGVLLCLLQNPSATLSQCACKTGYSPSHVSRIINSPVFLKKFDSIMDSEACKAAARFLLPKEA